jgi:SsrA-binding protein
MRVTNRKAKFNYELGDKIEAGVVLNGAEAKSIYEGKMSLEEAFAKLTNGEVWLYNCHIHPYRFASEKDPNPTRPRKLLLHRREIFNIEAKMKQKKLTLVPLACYTRGRKIKIELALGRVKKEFEKKKSRKEEEKRDISFFGDA